MPRHQRYLLHAMGVRRGLALSHNHLRHFYATTHHAKKATSHMLAAGLHKMVHHKPHHYNHHLNGSGAERRLNDEDLPEDGEGVRKSKHGRKPKPLTFKF